MRRILRIAAASSFALALGACGGSSKKAAPATPAEAAAPVLPAATARAGQPASAMPRSLPVEAEALDPPTPSPQALAVTAAPDEPPEYTALKARLLNGESGARAIKQLQALSRKHSKNAEIFFLLGELYLEKLWVDDGLKAFHRALELDPKLRSNPFLIRAVINGLGNDSDARQVRRFLTKEIGVPAAPYLVEVLYGDWRQQVKDRAKSVLEDIP